MITCQSDFALCPLDVARSSFGKLSSAGFSDSLLLALPLPWQLPLSCVGSLTRSGNAASPVALSFSVFCSPLCILFGWSYQLRVGHDWATKHSTAHQVLWHQPYPLRLARICMSSTQTSQLQAMCLPAVASSPGCLLGTLYVRVHAHAQLYPTLWGPMDCSPPGSSVHGILQARRLEWVAIPFSRPCTWLVQNRNQLFSSRIQSSLQTPACLSVHPSHDLWGWPNICFSSASHT